MSVDIKTEQAVPTNDFINVNVDAIAKVRVSPDPQGIQLAAKNFLNKKPPQIAMELQDSLQGNMREIIGTLELREINTDRDSFSDQVVAKASKDMAKLGNFVDLFLTDRDLLFLKLFSDFFPVFFPADLDKRNQV